MKCLKLAAAATAVIAAAALPGTACASLIWIETGPPGAGDSLATAQATVDSSFNTLDGIHGNLTATTQVNGKPLYQVDLFKIRISDFSAFSASTVNPSTAFDSALYLFDENGLGIFMNDDNGVDLLSSLPAGTATSNGLYYLAVALGGYSAFDASSMSLFQGDGSSSGAGALSSWLPGFEADSESALSYDIVLTGATNADLPEPGGIALLLAGGIAGWLSRRVSRGNASLAAA
jgi:hypothetical protein